MIGFFRDLFDTSDFPARWHCGNWTAPHGWLHVVSDVAIWGAYMAIPATLAFFILKRRDIPFLPIFWLFVAFIFSCGTSHLVEAGIFWWPAYRFSGAVKLVTAAVSWATVFALIPVLPRALALPGLGAVNNELQQALESAQQTEERLRQVIEAAPNGMIMVDERGTIVLANTAATQIFGYAREELVGQSIELLVPERFQGGHPGHRAAYMQQPEARPMGHGRDLYGRHRDGREVPVEIGLNPLAYDDDQLVLASVVDITERKLSEEMLAGYTGELERRNRDLDQFAYVASHDLRSPLEAIEKLAAWVIDDASERLPEGSRRHLELIGQRAQRLKNLLDDLLQYARAGRQGGELGQVDTGELVAQIVSDLNPPPGFEISVADGMPVIETLRTPLRHIFQNLIGNAIKHHDRTGGLIEIGYSEEADCYTFWVRDDGPGIDPAYHDRIFGMFETLRPRDEVEGSGMGLAIIRKLVDAYGGDITLESAPGAGATFRIRWLRRISA